MYSMILDSVRAKNDDNLILAEASMIKAALIGSPVVLTPNQAMDSFSVQEIILSNGVGGIKTNYFCEAVSRGLVNVALPEGNNSLIEYCVSAIRRGLINPDHEFIISGLDFLYMKDDTGKEHYPYEERKELLIYIANKLESYRTVGAIGFPGYFREQKILIEQYIESIILLDKSVKQFILLQQQKEMFLRFLVEEISSRLKSIYNEELGEVLCRLLSECEKEGAPSYRSYYYHFLRNIQNDYSSECLSEVKVIIDIAYNKVMSLSICHNNRNGLTQDVQSELYIPKEYGELTKSAAKVEKDYLSLETAYTQVDNESYINWEMMIWIYDETYAIMEEKGYSWKVAIRHFYEKQRTLPVKMSTKFLLFNAIKFSLSKIVPGFGMAVEFVTNLIQGEAETVAQDKLRIHGDIRNIFKETKRAKKTVKALDNIIYTKSDVIK